MKKKSILAVGLVAILAIIGVLVRRVAFAKEEPQYRFAKVERGNIRSTVSATGTLNAVTTVSVGTQVSGQVSDLFVDYNDHVKKGELLARIDPTLALQGVTDAQASLQKAQAEAVQAQRGYTRNRELLDSGLIARSDYEQTQSADEVANADVKSARVALDKAKQQLAYTNIYAPIDGVVVDRNVQKGQTVAASLSAPQLFLIANDLSKMQILASVGESDIAQIQPGQRAEFSVQALQGQTFRGVVQQVRLQSTVQDNVVDYTVVVNVDNAAGKLMPGMTARVNFLTSAARNVLMVPNAALRFRPATTASTTTATKPLTPAPLSPSFRRGEGTGKALYYLDANGKLASIKVQSGITDGTITQVSGNGLNEGMQVITGSASATGATQQAQTSASPFQSGQQQGGRGARGGF